MKKTFTSRLLKSAGVNEAIEQIAGPKTKGKNNMKKSEKRELRELRARVAAAEAVRMGTPLARRSVESVAKSYPSAEYAFLALKAEAENAPNPVVRRRASHNLLMAKMIAAENKRFAEGWRPGTGWPVDLFGGSTR